MKIEWVVESDLTKGCPAIEQLTNNKRTITIVAIVIITVEKTVEDHWTHVWVVSMFSYYVTLVENFGTHERYLLRMTFFFAFRFVLSLSEFCFRFETRAGNKNQWSTVFVPGNSRQLFS